MAPSIGILLCTCNGERFLGEQLDSIARQSHADWRLAVADDGSTDATRAIVAEFAARFPGRVSMGEGARAGIARNFLALAGQPGCSADYWAFCDQDDRWREGKLATAVAWLASVPATVPALYCSRTMIVDAKGRSLGLSPDWGRPPAFGNAILQNIASGNTMVFNEAARALLAERASAPVPFHDWLLYLVVTGCGGQVRFDRQPQVDYRQHGANALGPWRGPAARWRRLRIVAGGEYGAWIAANLEALRPVAGKLTADSRQRLDQALAAMQASGIERVRRWRRAGLYHQSAGGTLLLMAAALSGSV